METYESPLTNDEKGLDWITLSRSCLKSGCPNFGFPNLEEGVPYGGGH